MLHGNGELKWNDGGAYKGEFLADKMHGQGVKTWADGRRYEGTYQNGLQHGEGILFADKDDKTGRKGTWSKGK
jgi:hypothetical protein